MRRTPFLIAFLLMLPLAAGSQTPPPSLPLGAGRPDTPGITRTTLKDDAKATVTRVHFDAGAEEPNHTHPFDMILVPVMDGAIVEIAVGDKTLAGVKAGEVQFVPRDVVHHVKNMGKAPFELIAIGLK